MARDNYTTGGRGHRRERRISVRGVRRAEPDLRKLAQALIALAQAQAEADALAEHQDQNDDEGMQSPKEAA
jgi:hypothetical protein